MITARQAIEIFNRSIADYHLTDNPEQPINNPFSPGTDEISNLLYQKNWIDTVQWHLEDIIRNPAIDPEKALGIKRWIDKSNQERTDTVEKIDDWYIANLPRTELQPGAQMNSETPAWMIDRISILTLKIYHMKAEVERADATDEHKIKCNTKLEVLYEQEKDLSLCHDQLIEEIEAGRRYTKVYRQMKMYNDPSTNPVLYKKP